MKAKVHKTRAILAWFVHVSKQHDLTEIAFMFGLPSKERARQLIARGKRETGKYFQSLQGKV